MDIIDLPGQPREAEILALRDFSRRLVRELGFMRTTLADSDLAPSAVHAIIEIGAAPGISAKDLGNLLRLDKSNTSRQVAKLEAAGLVHRTTASGDARTSQLQLTEAGQRLRRKIDRYATDQVSSALRRIVPADQETLVRSLALYADALAQDNRAKGSAPPAPTGQIVEGYRPGCIGDIASLHGRFYAEHWGIVRHPGKRFENLAQYRWGTYSTTENPVDTWLVKRNRMPVPIYRIYWQDLTALTHWVAATPESATVLPWHAVKGLVEAGRLRFESLGRDAIKPLYLAYPRASPHKSHKELIASLLAQGKRYGESLEETVG